MALQLPSIQTCCRAHRLCPPGNDADHKNYKIFDCLKHIFFVLMIFSLIQELPSFSNLILSTPSPLLQTPPTPGGSLTNLPAAGSIGANQQQQATPTTPPIPGPPTGQATQPSTPGANVKQPSKGLRLSVSNTCTIVV